MDPWFVVLIAFGAALFWVSLVWVTFDGIWKPIFKGGESFIEQVFVFFFWWIIALGYVIARAHGIMFKRNKK